VSWPVVKLSDVAELINGDRSSNYPSGEDIVEEGILFLSTKNIVENKIDLSQKSFITKEKFNSLGRGKLLKNDLIITLRGTLGSCCIFNTEYDTGFINAQMMIIRCKDEVSNRYLHYYLTSLRVNCEFQRANTGSAVPQLTGRQLAELEIPLPPLNEQKRIAAILDKADAIRRKRQLAIQLADDFLRSVFLDMFGDPVINPKGWGFKKINSITTDWRGGAPFKPDDFTDEGVNVLHKGAIQRNNNVLIDTKKKTYTSEAFAKKYKKSEVDQSFLAVTLRDLVPSGPSIGLISNLKGSIGKNYILAQGAYGFKCKENLVKPSYLVYLTNNNSFRSTLSKYWVGSTQIHIRTPIFKEIEIPIPPINIQDEFEKVVKKHRTQFNKSLETIAGSEALFNSLSQKAFAGEL
jgi:type I restriction enzyme S subunit|tara:strand:+ start:508 stop:1725 length:1218 start_codon:yes stop_codon:yes gene_type:complete